MSILLQQFNVLYLDSNNLIHDINYSWSTHSWSPGSLAGKGYTVLENSGLSTLYHQCRFCSNTTVIAFQDQKGNVQIGNLSSAGWTLTQLELNLQLPTGLALQSQLISGQADQINLYHQKADLKMALAARVPGFVERGRKSNLTFFKVHHLQLSLDSVINRTLLLPPVYLPVPNIANLPQCFHGFSHRKHTLLSLLVLLSPLLHQIRDG